MVSCLPQGYQQVPAQAAVAVAESGCVYSTSEMRGDGDNERRAHAPAEGVVESRSNVGDDGCFAVGAR